jgi:hypothetical protein
LTGRGRGWHGLRALLQAFYTAIQTEGPSPVPATQGLRVVTLLEEISRQLLAMPDAAQARAGLAYDDRR